MTSPHYQLLFAGSVALTFLLDRFTKMAAVEHLAAGPVSLFSGCRLTLMYNSGISFSLFSSATGVISWQLTALIAVIVAVLIVSWRLYATSALADLGFGLIIGGAIANFVDRLCIGGVIDFIELYYGCWSWPTFNVADIAIVLGFICIVSESVYEAKNK